MARIKHVVDGKEIELELDGVLTAEEVAASYIPKVKFENEQQKFNRLLDKAKNAAADEFLQDESFKAKALETWKLPKDGQPTPEQIAAIADGVRARELKPVVEKLTATEGELHGLRRNTLRADLLTAARQAGVREELLTPLGPNKPAPIVAILEQQFQFGYDGEAKMHTVLGDDGQPVYAERPTKDAPYKTPYELVVEWGRSKTAAPFIDTKKQNVPGPGGTQPGGMPRQSGGTVSNDPLSIGRNLEAIAKGEVKVAVAQT